LAEDDMTKDCNIKVIIEEAHDRYDQSHYNPITALKVRERAAIESDRATERQTLK
jgi:hypothetical protein